MTGSEHNSSTDPTTPSGRAAYPDRSPRHRPPVAAGPLPRPEPLASDVAPGLRRLDASLGRLAHGADVPAGLARRVFTASVRLLPVRPLTAAAGRRAPTTSWRWPDLGVLSGRLALAATLALAFVMAARFLERPPGAGDSMVGADLGFLESDPLEQLDNEFAYLLDTGTVTRDDVTGEMNLMILALGM